MLSTKNLHQKLNNVTEVDDQIVNVEKIDLPSLELSDQTQPKMTITVSQDDVNDQKGTTQLKIVPSEEFNTALN